MIFGRNIQKSLYSLHVSVSYRFPFLSTFLLSNRTPKITRIFDAVSSKRGNFDAVQ